MKHLHHNQKYRLKSTSKDSRSTKGYGVLQLSIAVLLLSVMGLLFANVTTMYLARNYNTQVCMNAAIAGAQAATSGCDENQVAHIVEQTVGQSGGGFLINAPELHGLAFHKIEGNNCLVVNTVILTSVPAPMLLAYSDSLEGGHVFFSKTCVITLNNGKGKTKGV